LIQPRWNNISSKRNGGFGARPQAKAVEISAQMSYDGSIETPPK